MAYFTGAPSFIAIAGGIASHSPAQSSSLRAHCTHMNYISLKDTIPALMDVMDDNSCWIGWCYSVHHNMFFLQWDKLSASTCPVKRMHGESIYLYRIPRPLCSLINSQSSTICFIVWDSPRSHTVYDILASVEINCIAQTLTQVTKWYALRLVSEQQSFLHIQMLFTLHVYSK